MKNKSLFLLFLCIISISSCSSNLQDVSLNQIPEGGEKVTYNHINENLKPKTYDAMSFELKDSNYYVLEESSVYDPYFGTTETLSNKVDISNLNLSMFQTNIKDTKETSDVKASLNLNADIKTTDISNNKTNKSIDIKSYIKNNTMYAEVNEDSAIMMGKESAGKYSFDLSENDFSYELPGFEIDASIVASNTTNINNKIVYSYLTSKYTSLKEVKVDENGFPSVFEDDDSFTVGKSGNNTYDYGLVVYNEGQKVKIGQITGKILDYYIVDDELVEETSLSMYISSNQIVGFVVEVKDSDGNYKDFYQKFDTYKEIYDDSIVLLDDLFNTYADIYRYKDEYLFNLNFDKNTFKEKTNSFFDKVVDHEIYYFVTGGKKLKLDEEIRNALLETIDQLFIGDFQFKLTATINKYGITRLLFSFDYNYENNYKNGRKECSYKNKININLDFKASYYKRKRIKYPNLEDYNK